MGVALLFLLATALGCLATLYWIPEDDLGRGYFQMNALVILGLLALAGAIVVLHPVAPFRLAPRLGGGSLALALAAAFGYYGAMWLERWPLARAAAAGATGATAVALLVAGLGLTPAPTPLPHRPLLLAAALLTSALLLGWSLVTMLLGHWYLVAPRLSFHHLTVFCRALLAMVGLRGAAVAVTVLAAASVGPAVEPHPLALATGLAGEGMFFWFRVLWGLGIPLVLAAMALHCARQRSNQSATGILYVLVVGAFIGEITALYLTVATGVPL